MASRRLRMFTTVLLRSSTSGPTHRWLIFLSLILFCWKPLPSAISLLDTWILIPHFLNFYYLREESKWKVCYLCFCSIYYFSVTVSVLSLIFPLTVSSLQYFRREETNFISQNEIDNMTLIMPTASSRSRVTAGPDPVSAAGGKVKVRQCNTFIIIFICHWDQALTDFLYRGIIFIQGKEVQVWFCLICSHRYRYQKKIKTHHLRRISVCLKCSL